MNFGEGNQNGAHSSDVEAKSVSTTLLHLVKANDAIGWDRLVKLFSPLVYHWCRSRGLDSQAAGDVCQEVFAAVSKSVGGFQRQNSKDTFRGWLWTITINKIRDYARKSKTQPAVVGGTDFHQVLGNVADDVVRSEDEQQTESSLLLKTALQLIETDFEPQSVQIFMRSVMDEKTAREISSELGVTVAAVYKAKSRVIKRLRDEMADLLD